MILAKADTISRGANMTPRPRAQKTAIPPTRGVRRVCMDCPALRSLARPLNHRKRESSTISAAQVTNETTVEA